MDSSNKVLAKKDYSPSFQLQDQPSVAFFYDTHTEYKRIIIWINALGAAETFAKIQDSLMLKVSINLTVK